MQIKLRSIEHSEAMSEETFCYTAKVYIDGKLAGTARNDGKGGSTIISPRECEERLEAYALTLPDRVYKAGTPDQFTLKMTADMLVDDLLVEHLQAKDLKGHFKKDVLFTVEGEPGVRRMKNMTPERFLAHPRLSSLNVDKVLNQLPFEEALNIYKTAINAIV